MTLAELPITRENLARARSQRMVNTLYRIRRAFYERGLSDDMFLGAAVIAVATEVSGQAYAEREPGTIGRLTEGKSGKFLLNLVEELFSRYPDHGPVLDYNVNAPDGSQIEIRNHAATMAN